MQNQHIILPSQFLDQPIAAFPEHVQTNHPVYKATKCEIQGKLKLLKKNNINETIQLGSF